MTRTRRRMSPGFTMIELVVVLGIIAILSLMALPGYLEGNVRKQLGAALPLADVAKRPVAAAWAAGLPLPANNADAGLPAPDLIVDNQVSSVAIDNGAIHLTFGNNAVRAIRGKVLTLRPAVVESAPVVPVAWVCAGARVPDKMSVRGTDRTTVPRAYLPFECRSGG
jgi:type IV pilus assembly protein PilA